METGVSCQHGTLHACRITIGGLDAFLRWQTYLLRGAESVLVVCGKEGSLKRGMRDFGTSWQVSQPLVAWICGSLMSSTSILDTIKALLQHANRCIGHSRERCVRPEIGVTVCHRYGDRREAELWVIECIILAFNDLIIDTLASSITYLFANLKKCVP